MPYPHITAKIICDSLNDTASVNKRLTTFELTYPRYLHAEIMTHRVLSRNAQSSRAIPVVKRLKRVRENPVTPIRWGKNQAGMQAKDEDLEGDQLLAVTDLWAHAAEIAASCAESMSELGLHKQWANRVLEPFDTITVIATASNWDNFFGLRCHPDAQPEFQDLAWKMADLYYWHTLKTPEQRAHLPAGFYAPSIRTLSLGEWHLPYISTDEEHAAFIASGDAAEHEANYLELAKMSVARCARVSYLTHDGDKPDQAKDIALHDRLLKDFHLSPFEHQARPFSYREDPDVRRIVGGNFGPGWVQYRKILSVPELRTFDYVEALKTRKLA